MPIHPIHLLLRLQTHPLVPIILSLVLLGEAALLVFGVGPALVLDGGLAAVEDGGLLTGHIVGGLFKDSSDLLFQAFEVFLGGAIPGVVLGVALAGHGALSHLVPIVAFGHILLLLGNAHFQVLLDFLIVGVLGEHFVHGGVILGESHQDGLDLLLVQGGPSEVFGGEVVGRGEALVGDDAVVAVLPREHVLLLELGVHGVPELCLLMRRELLLVPLRVCGHKHICLEDLLVLVVAAAEVLGVGVHGLDALLGGGVGAVPALLGQHRPPLHLLLPLVQQVAHGLRLHEIVVGGAGGDVAWLLLVHRLLRPQRGPRRHPLVGALLQIRYLPRPTPLDLAGQVALRLHHLSAGKQALVLGQGRLAGGCHQEFLCGPIRRLDAWALEGLPLREHCPRIALQHLHILVGFELVFFGGEVDLAVLEVVGDGLFGARGGRYLLGVGDVGGVLFESGGGLLGGAALAGFQLLGLGVGVHLGLVEGALLLRHRACQLRRVVLLPHLRLLLDLLVLLRLSPLPLVLNHLVFVGRLLHLDRRVRESAEVQPRQSHHLDLRLRILHQEPLHQLVHLHLVDPLRPLLVRLDLLRLVLILLSAHVQLVYTVVESGVEELVFIEERLVVPLGVLFELLLVLIDQLLLLLNVFEHVLVFWEDDVVGEDLGVLVVEAAELGEPRLHL
mmetsp:Transcript_39579/g.38091  ORF Transcript_39579/g.38091 Transcript_39579/m.38091 type:complete len:671 (+) Transcript_39579:579-2591(+)